jgi:peptidoglycan/xylan/chitin deacetylase (PgdA/CDA1 family)
VSVPGRLAHTVYRRPRLGRPLRRLRPRACVLLYHRVAETPHDPYGQAVPPNRFEEQLRALTARFDVEPVEALVRGGFRDGTVAVTFDDGYADNLHAAAPLAARAGVPLCVFAAGGAIADERAAFWWDELAAVVLGANGAPGRLAELMDAQRRLRVLAADERTTELAELRRNADAGAGELDLGRPLSLDELRSLAALPDVTIGSHTRDHPALAPLPEAEQARELTGGKELLERLLGRRVPLVAYPFGKHADVSRRTVALARQAGYDAAFTTVPRPLVPRSDRYRLPRLTAHDWPAQELVARVEALIGT